MYLVDTWTKTLLGTVHASDCSLALLAERGSGGVGGALGGGDDGKSGAQDKRGWSSRKASRSGGKKGVSKSDVPGDVALSFLERFPPPDGLARLDEHTSGSDPVRCLWLS